MVNGLQVKYLPAWHPGASFKREAKRMRTDVMRACERPYEHVKKEVDASVYKNSFSHELLSEPDLIHYKRELIKWSALLMYLGGSDTTVSMIYTFFLVMVLFPDVNARPTTRFCRLLVQAVCWTLRIDRYYRMWMQF